MQSLKRLLSFFFVPLIPLVVAVTCITVAVPSCARANDNPVTDQVIQDLVAAGISAGAAVSGSVPLALSAGLLAKYISTYGVAGIRSVIDYVKGYGPRDIGEVNLLYVYLLNTKRNLFQAMINIRKSVDNDDGTAGVAADLDRLETELKKECDPSAGCAPDAFDINFVNINFLNIILDAKQSLDILKYLKIDEVKDTYHYLMLLYLDIVILEQKLMESEVQVLADRSVQTIEELNKNPYFSNEEKEYQAELVMNLALRWLKMTQMRQDVVAKAVAGPLNQLESENQELENEINRYRPQAQRKGGLK